VFDPSRTASSAIQACTATSAIGVWINRAGGETEQPQTTWSPEDARWRLRAPDLFTLRNSLNPPVLPGGRNRYCLPQ